MDETVALLTLPLSPIASSTQGDIVGSDDETQVDSEDLENGQDVNNETISSDETSAVDFSQSQGLFCL